MKAKYLIMTCLLILLAFNSIAQEKVEVTTSEKEMSAGLQLAFTVNVPEANTKLVESEWRKYINERSFFEFATKGTSQTMEKAFIGISNIFSSEKKTFKKNSLKVEKVGNELVVKDVIHEEVTNDHIDVYAQIYSDENNVYLSSFFQYSDSVFINESNITNEALASIKNYIRQFGVEAYKSVVKEQISEEDKVLRQMNSDLNKLERQNKDLYKDIDRFDANIEDYKNSIRLVNNDLDRIEGRITELKDSLQLFEKKSYEYDSLKDLIKETEKEHRSNYNDIKSYNKKIKNQELKIRNKKTDILINEKEQKLQLDIIRNQEMRIKDFDNKLSNIT